MATHHIRTSFWIALISFVAPGVALSATPAFDCAKADSSAEKAICASDMLAELDVELDRLYRLEGSRNRNSGGSGLGLAICRNIVEAHGGQIMAQPGPHGGILITTTLPLET